MSEMQSRQVRNDLPDVISLDQLPDAPAAPDVIDINTLPDAIDINSLPDAQPAQPALPDASLGTFADSVGRSYNEFNVQRGIADRVRIEAMLRELDAGGNPDINPVKTWGDSIKMDIGRSLGANVETPDVKRQYLLNRLGQINEEIKSSDAAVKSYGQGSQQLSDLQAGLQEAQKKDSFLSKIGSALSALYSNPKGIPELIGGGAYTMGRPIAAGITAAALSKGRTLIPMVASAAVSGADSYDGTMAEIIEQKGREGGIDVRKNPEAIPTLLQDAGFIEAAKGEALRRGISDAAWSAISMRLGMSPKIKGVWQPIVQSGAEVTTELSGQLAQKGRVYDPTALPVAGVAGFGFEGPSYALGRAVGAFGKPEATAAPAAQPQAQTQAAPDVIDINTLPDAPSVAGETVEPAAAAPAPAVPEAAAPAPVQPAPAVETPAPVQPVVETPKATEPVATKKPRSEMTEKDLVDQLDADFKAGKIDEDTYWNSRRQFAVTPDDTKPMASVKQPAPAAAQPVAEPAPAQTPPPVAEAAQPAAVQAEAAPAAQAQPTPAQPVAIPQGNVEPAPTYPGDKAPVAQRKAWQAENKAWREKYGKTHWTDGTPKTTPSAPAQPTAQQQTEIPGTADTFNLTGEQVAAPRETAQDTTAEMPLGETRDNPLMAEARARLAKLEAAGKGDSEQAAALRRTIQRESKPAAPAQAEAKTVPPNDVVPPEGYENPNQQSGTRPSKPSVSEQAKPAQQEAAPAAEQSKAQPATQPKAQPTTNEAAKAKKTDQPQTKRARTALRNALRQFGKEDLRTRKKYRAVLDALEREKAREARARDVSQPYLGREEPADIKQARALLAKKSLATGGISSYDVAKANALIEQYEVEVDLSMGQLRDDGQIRQVSDETLDRVIAHVQGMLDAGKKPDADALNALSLAQDERVRRETDPGEAYGDPIADVRAIVRKSGGAVAIPDLPTSIFKDTEYSGLKENLPHDLSLKGGVFAEPFGGIDLERAKKDADYRNQIRDKAEGMLDDLHERLVELGWTQVEGGNDVVQLLQEAATGKPIVPAGGVGGASFKGDPNKVDKIHGGTINLDMLSSEGAFNADEQADTREAEPSDEDKQTAVDMEVEYENSRYDAEPSPADQAVLDAAADNAPTEQSILDALDNAAREALDPKNLNEIYTSIPRVAAALTWMTARQIQKGVINFAKWSVETARKFPALKGSIKTIWAKAQQIAKQPMDYITFRALNSIPDKAWQNVRRNKGSATLRKIANTVFAKAGPDADAVENDIPTRINTVRNQFSNIYAGIMERFAAEFADMTPEQRRQWDADFRKAVIEGTTPSDPKVAKAVKDFRNLMRDLLGYQRDAGIEMGDQGGNYFPRHYDPDAVEANRDGFIDAAMEMYRKRDERLLDKAVDDVRKQQETRPDERRAADKKFGRKEKTDAEYEQEAAEWAQEKIAALEAEHAAKDDDFYKQKAEDWATAITHGDVLGLTLFKASEGKVTSDATDARTFNNDEAALADEFLKKNVDDIMLGYIDGAVRGAELARVFGQDGKKFEQMMNQLSREGVDAETIKETRSLVQKALGVGREQSSQATAAFFDWVNVVLAGAFLGKTFVYNLVLEPISFGIRTGNAYLALKGMTDTWRYTINEVFANPSPAMKQRIRQKYGNRFKFEKAVTETVGEQVGLIQNEMERSYLNSHWDYSSGEKGSKLAKWISQRIYRANLMSATEKAKVQASIGIARLALRDNARFFTGDAPIQKLFASLGMDTNADKSAAVILRENGVPDADHKAFAAWVAGLEGKTDAEWQAAVMDPKDPMAKHYRRALQRMSLGMSIKTNPALKMEMSDSIMGRLMMQLMNYSYAYSNLVKDRMYSMAAATFSKDASKIDRLRYAAPLLVGAPLAIMGSAASKALIAALWPSDEEEERRKKVSGVRKAFDYASFAGMFGPKVEYLFKSFERGQAPGGPVGETVFRGGQAAFAAAGDPESEKKAYNARKQAYNSTVKPLVTGAGAAVHPFFGFLGNAAVNSQDVRESFTGEKPRR